MGIHRRPLTSGLFVCLLMMTACGAPETGGQAPASPPPAEGGGAAGLPSGFPEDFPLPPEFQITEAAFTEGDAYTQANYLVRGASLLSVSEIAAFYYDRLPAAGYDIHGPEPSPGAPNAVVPLGNEAIQDGSVQLSAGGETTNVLISLPLRD